MLSQPHDTTSALAMFRRLLSLEFAIACHQQLQQIIETAIERSQPAHCCINALQLNDYCTHAVIIKPNKPNRSVAGRTDEQCQM